MKTVKYNLFITLLLCITMVFSQSRTQKSSEKFYVNNDVIVEINVHNSDIVVEHWYKNEVLVETVLTIDGVTVKEAKEYFDGWKIEALGNKNKVVITSVPNFHHEYGDFDLNFDFDFDFEPVLAYAFDFDSVSFPIPPEMPMIIVDHLHKIQWDQNAYNKDNEKYLKKFEKQQKAWAEEMEKNFEPQLKAFEEEMEKWEKEFSKKYEPQMEAYEKEMKKWQKDFEPKLKKHEEMMKEREKKMQIKVNKIEIKHEKSIKMKKKIYIKIPRNAKVKLNTHDSSIELPKDVNRI